MAATTGTPRRSFTTSPRSQGGSHVHQESSESNIRIPFHGSCSRCHHFHVNHPFTFSPDSTVHTRLPCERCNHPMFGLGRVSTQSTLASVESGTTFNPRACINPLGQQQESTSQAQTVPGSSTLGLLTTISERRSPAASRSTSNIRTSTRTLSETSLSGQEAGGSIGRGEPVGGRAEPKDAPEESPKNQALHPQTTTFRRLRTIGHRFKRRFSATRKDWKLPRIRLQITHAPSVGITGHSSATASASNVGVSSRQEQSENAEQPVSGAGDDAEDRHASLRARRRELTLAKEREMALNRECECGPECPCISGSTVPQVDRADTPDILVPSYVLPPHHSSTESSNSQPSQNSAQGPDPLTHIGDHFETSRRSSSADESSSAAESGSRRHRLSQGSTLWSNASSISLRTRRPLVGRASTMPVGTRVQHLAGLRTGWPGTARAQASLDDGSMPEGSSHTASSSSRNHEPSSHQSSASPANLPDHQEEEGLVNGVSPTSHTPMRDVDEVTPTPRSGIRMDGNSEGMLPVGSEGLSSALQNLTNGDMTDHEVQSPESQANDPSD